MKEEERHDHPKGSGGVRHIAMLSSKAVLSHTYTNKGLQTTLFIAQRPRSG